MKKTSPSENMIKLLKINDLEKNGEADTEWKAKYVQGN